MKHELEQILKYDRYCELVPFQLMCIRRPKDCRASNPIREFCAECEECSRKNRELVMHYNLPPVVLLAYDPPPDHLSRKEKLKYWDEALELAIAEAMEV